MDFKYKYFKYKKKYLALKTQLAGKGGKKKGKKQLNPEVLLEDLKTKV